MDDAYTTLICSEQYGLTNRKREYTLSSGGRVLQKDRSPRHTSLLRLFSTVFLPQGYPDSVSEDYAEYQLWDTVQAFASSVSNTLATHSLLHGMGVGDESATVLAATFTWLIKDGTGMVGRIIFAWMKGTQLDCDAKRWRLFADFLNDFAICLEILAPLTQAYFRWVVCVAGVCKSLVGVAGGSTRAALTQHQARRNNMADVSAKDGSQETVVNLAALLCSLAILPTISGQFQVTCVLFAMLTALHLFANFKAVKAVKMESFNQARLRIIVEQYLRTGQALSIAAVNSLEPVLWGGRQQWTVKLGASFACISENFEDLKQAYKGLSTRYMLFIDRMHKAFVILLSPEAQSMDQLQACVHAELVAFLMSGQDVHPDLRKFVGTAWGMEGDRSLLRQSYLCVQNFFPVLLSDVRAKGWNPDLCLLAAEEWRVSWDLVSRKDI